MGLEAATYISQLTPTNPGATDKKNQGDDHLRLLKAVLQNNFPNADHAIRFPSILSKNVDYTALEADDRATILVDTAAAGRTITLPTPANAAWAVKVLKSTNDANPVYVVPPSGTINGLFAKIRINVPFSEMEFIWTGSAFYRPKAAGVVPPGTIEWMAANPINGYASAAGSSLVRADYPELFAAIGTVYGAVDGTHFTLPNIIDRFPVGAGVNYAMGATGGEATHVLTIAELAAHQHNGATDNGGVDHTHLYNGPGAAQQDAGPSGNGMAAETPLNRTTGGASAYLHTHPFTTNTTGGNAAHENRPPYFGLVPMMRLC